jgi:hypothetical protein
MVGESLSKMMGSLPIEAIKFIAKRVACASVSVNAFKYFVGISAFVYLAYALELTHFNTYKLSNWKTTPVFYNNQCDGRGILPK